MDIKYLALHYAQKYLVLKGNKLDVKASFDSLCKLLKLKSKYHAFLKNKLCLATRDKNHALFMMQPIKMLILNDAKNDINKLFLNLYLSGMALFAPSKMDFSVRLPLISTMHELKVGLFRELALSLKGVASTYYARLALFVELDKIKKLLKMNPKNSPVKINLALSKDLEKDFFNLLAYKDAALIYGENSPRTMLAKTLISNVASKEVPDFSKQLKNLQALSKALTPRLLKSDTSLQEGVKTDLSTLSKLSLDQIQLYIYEKQFKASEYAI